MTDFVCIFVPLTIESMSIGFRISYGGIRVTVYKTLANVFLSTKMPHFSNHKVKSGKFGITGLGKHSGV